MVIWNLARLLHTIELELCAKCGETRDRMDTKSRAAQFAPSTSGHCYRSALNVSPAQARRESAPPLAGQREHLFGG